MMQLYLAPQLVALEETIFKVFFFCFLEGVLWNHGTRNSVLSSRPFSFSDAERFHFYFITLIEIKMDPSLR